MKTKFRMLLMLAVALIATCLLFTGCQKKAAKEDAKDTDPGIRYVSFGNGEKTMVVIPGLNIGYVTANKEGLENAFAAFTEDYTIYVFDVRDEVPEDYSIAGMGDDLVTVFNKLGLTDIHLYGCSMGGMQSLYIAGKYPELVKKVAVAASAAKANENSNKVIENWIALAKEGKCRELTANMGQLIYSASFYEANEKAFETMADGLTEEVLGRFCNTARVIVDFDITKEAASIKCPVFILGSEGDRVLTGDASKEIAEITGGELYMYGEDQPHAVYDEAPDLKGRVKDFFDK